MKVLLNIILLTLVFSTTNCQENKIQELENEFDSILALYRLEVADLLEQNLSLATENTKLQMECDSLGLVIEGEGDTFPYIVYKDTIYAFFYDSTNSSIEINKVDNYIRTVSSVAEKRIATWYRDGYRNVYFMDSTKTNLSVLEDSLGYSVNFNGFRINIDKQ